MARYHSEAWSSETTVGLYLVVRKPAGIIEIKDVKIVWAK